MISHRAKTGFEKLFARSLDESLRTETCPVWHIQPVSAKAIDAKHFIMLTISSFDFRLIVLLHFSTDTSAFGYVADNIKVPAEELTYARYQDYLSETGNLLCGTIKRLLFQIYPHLGMSSPNHLILESLKYVDSIKIDHSIHLNAQSESGAGFYGSLYISAVGNLDFDPAVIAETEENIEMGALELF
jgi:hypothetical protein